MDVAQGRLLHRLEGHAKPIRSVAYTADGSALITASDDMHINVYDTKSNQLISSLAGHSSWVLSVAASPDKNHFATSSSDKKVTVCL
jgi:WD repeat-containing protein 61